jgi:hypothetical protein
MDIGQIVDSPILEGPVVDPFRDPGRRKRRVRQFRPSFSDPDQLLLPVASRESSGFPAPAPAWIPENFLWSWSGSSVQQETLGEDQMAVLIMSIRPPSMDRPRIGHPPAFTFHSKRHLTREFPDEGNPLLLS